MFAYKSDNDIGHLGTSLLAESSSDSNHCWLYASEVVSCSLASSLPKAHLLELIPLASLEIEMSFLHLVFHSLTQEEGHAMPFTAWSFCRVFSTFSSASSFPWNQACWSRISAAVSHHLRLWPSVIPHHSHLILWNHISHSANRCIASANSG